MSFSQNSDLPVSVRELSPVAQTAWRQVCNAALADGRAHTDAFFAAWDAVQARKGSGGPNAGDVHVDKPLAGRGGGMKRSRRRRRAAAAKWHLPPWPDSGTRSVKRQASTSDWSLRAKIFKADDELRVVWGWASIIKEDGAPIVDHHDHIITEPTLVKAAHEFITVRVGKVMHDGEAVAQMVESMVLTEDLTKALDIDTKGRVGWVVAFKVLADDIWTRVKSGELGAFSIGGLGVLVDA